MKRYSAVFAAAIPGMVALAFVLGALSMPTFGNRYTSPGLYPLIVGGIMLLLSIILVLQEVGKLRPREADDGRQAAGRDRGWWLRTGYIIGAMALFVASIWFRVSFVLSSALFLAATLFFYARTRVLSNILLIAALSVGMYYVFTRVFFIPLP